MNSIEWIPFCDVTSPFGMASTSLQIFRPEEKSSTWANPVRDAQKKRKGHVVECCAIYQFRNYTGTPWDTSSNRIVAVLNNPSHRSLYEITCFLAGESGNPLAAWKPWDNPPRKTMHLASPNWMKMENSLGMHASDIPESCPFKQMVILLLWTWSLTTQCLHSTNGPVFVCQGGPRVEAPGKGGWVARLWRSLRGKVVGWPCRRLWWGCVWVAIQFAGIHGTKICGMNIVFTKIIEA